MCYHLDRQEQVAGSIKCPLITVSVILWTTEIANGNIICWLSCREYRIKGGAEAITQHGRMFYRGRTRRRRWDLSYIITVSVEPWTSEMLSGDVI